MSATPHDHKALIVLFPGCIELEVMMVAEILGRAIAHERGAVLAAICVGPLALANAGVLRGHAYTQSGFYPESMAHVWDGAEHRQEQVVVDRTIITALPEAFIDFAVAVARKMNVYDDAEAARRRDYFRGVHDRDWSKIGAVKGI